METPSSTDSFVWTASLCGSPKALRNNSSYMRRTKPLVEKVGKPKKGPKYSPRRDPNTAQERKKERKENFTQNHYK